MTKRRLLQGILMFALYRVSRSPGRRLTMPFRKAAKTPPTPGERVREALFGTGLIPAALVKAVSDKQRTPRQHASH
jgi:hypothetical protein